MRSKFGRYAQQLRAKRGLSLKDFSEKTGISMPRICNLEAERTAINEDVLRAYLKALSTSGQEAHDLRQLAQYSDKHRKFSDAGSPVSPTQALLEVLGDKLSPEAVAKINDIIARECSGKAKALFYARDVKKVGDKPSHKRPSLSTSRFVDIAILAAHVRRDYVDETHKIDFGLLLERLCADDSGFDYTIVEVMPAFAAGAFACIFATGEDHTLLIEEERFCSMLRGVHFCRHVVAHEIGHHYLHADKLVGAAGSYFAPQELAKNSANKIGSDEKVERRIDTIQEVEAEVFATCFLIPWEAFLKGTTAEYLSRDYGEEREEVERISKLMALQSVRDEFKRQLFLLGERSHPIFHMS